ncbi:ribosomal protein S18-alanine N-acetyltransferase [Advenella kashmirensis]|uniref:ribosomal protein S18-alanine N-acetyltransferase n=1 Tax=Advenella kashmirensis TaxID=310575 RepID=UPI00068038AC|nr:ribosomal protein S18-alanine N-acetyltransferase [Advenella kashmirensis]
MTVSPEGQTRSQMIMSLQQMHTIRRMTQQDIEAVVHIERRVQSHPWTEGNFFDALKAGYEAWVVCHGNEVVAFSLQLMAPDVAHLLLIGVAPDWQGRGIGAGLLAWGEERLLAQKLDSQVLEVRPSNTRAIAFYHRWGYEQIGVRKGYYPDGAVIAKMPGSCRKPWYPDGYGLFFSFCRRPARGASGQCYGQPAPTSLVARERD